MTVIRLKDHCTFYMKAIIELSLNQGVQKVTSVKPYRIQYVTAVKLYKVKKSMFHVFNSS